MYKVQIKLCKIKIKISKVQIKICKIQMSGIDWLDYS